MLFFLRLKATPNPAAVIEPRIVRGSGTAAGLAGTAVPSAGSDLDVVVKAQCFVSWAL